MEHLEKYYSKDYIEGLSSEMNFEEFLRLIKEISVKSGAQVKILDNGTIHLSGADNVLQAIHNSIEGIGHSDSTTENVETPPSENKTYNNKTEDSDQGYTPEVSSNEHDSIVDNLVVQLETSNNSSDSTAQTQDTSAPSPSTNQEGSPELVLDALGLFEKPMVETGTLVDIDDTTSTGALISGNTNSEISPAVTHVTPQDVTIADDNNEDIDTGPQNADPIAMSDTLSVNQDTVSANIHTALLSNDTDNEALDISSVNTVGTLGNIVFNDIGNTITYATGNSFDYLAAGETTTDTFFYTASDGLGGTNTASVTVTVTGVNDGPVAQNDTFTTDEDTNTNGNVFQNNGNGIDVDIDTTDSFTVTAVSGSVANVAVSTDGSHGGSFTIQSNGALSFNVDNDFQDLGTGATRDTTITYTITDTQGATNTATVTVTVTGINDMPSAVDDGIYNETDEGGSTVIITEAELLANDTDPESDPLDIVNITIGAGEGSIVDNGDGTWTYTSPADSLSFNGIATLTYTAQDTDGLTDTAVFDLRVFNVLTGTSGDDIITHQGNNTSHKLIGLDGNDTITGTDQRDILIGGNGDDILTGDNGDDDFIFEGNLTGIDTVIGGSGTDRILGGTGDDTFSLASFSSISEIDMGTGTDTLLGTAGDDAFNFSGITITDLDIINGNGGTDTIVGTGSGNDIDLSNVTSLIGITHINGGAGNDTIHGSQDHDLFIIESGDDRLYGEGGDDTFQLDDTLFANRKYIYGGNGTDQILGTAGDDTLQLVVLTGIEHIDLGAGTNTIIVDSGDDIDFSSITAGNFLNVTYLTDHTGNEDLTGSQGDDVFNMRADGGNDTFNGHDGNDTFNIAGTQSGDDRIDGGTGHDQILGSVGNDSLRLVSLTNIEHIDLGGGTNTIIVDSGDDLDFSSLAAGDFLNVTYLTDDTGSEDITGSQGDDVFNMRADGGNDTFNGHDGNDTFNIAGTQSGDDRIDGGTGHDQILGSVGDDSLRLASLTNIEHIDLGGGTNTIIVDSGDDINFSALAAGDFMNVSFITDDTGSEDITGSQGDDVFNMRADGGNDRFYGEGGNDTFNIAGTQSGDDRIDGGTGYDQILGSAGDDSLRIIVLTNIEHIDLGAGTNTITVDYGDSVDFSSIAAGDFLNVSFIADDVSAEDIIGSQGDDIFQINADSGNDEIYGDEGNDTFMISGTQNGDDRYHGGNGYDRILGSAGDDSLRLDMITGIEHIDLGGGTNTIIVDYGEDFDFSSFAAADFLNVSFIADDVSAEEITGSQGDDIFQVRADAGNDIFNGHDGNDTFLITGIQNGDDRYDGGNGTDQILGSAGDDTLRIRALSNIEHIDLAGGNNTILVDYGTTLDLSGFAAGTVLNVTLTDDVSIETIHGSQGDDIFRTRSDSNIDILYGEDGADTFMFDAAQHTADTIADFDVSEGDKIDISDILSYDSSIGDLISDFVQLVADGDGDPANGSGNVTLMVDIDGTENGTAYQSFAIFDDQGQTLADLINNGHLVIE
ncbi:MAG: beta strand repeat-containing protein [Alphaproteobacteria bacterium]